MTTTPEAITVALTGDSIITRRVPADLDEPTRRLVALLQQANVSFTNLEVLPNDFQGYPAVESGGTHLAAPSWVLDELVAMGFDLFGCANNHALDYSIEGLLATMHELERRGLPYAGVGRTLADARMPAYVDHPNGSVAMLSCTSTFAKSQVAGEQRPEMQGRPGLSPLRYQAVYDVTPEQLSQLRKISADLGLDRQQQELIDMGFAFAPTDPEIFQFKEANLRTAGQLDASFRAADHTAVSSTPHEGDTDALTTWVREARARADVVIVSLHSHEQGDDKEEPASFARDFARRMIDAGADVVVGHGPHLLRGMELYDGKPIFYSLGNFIGQNELVQKLPADSYEQFRVDPTQTPSAVFRSRTDNDRRSFPADARFWETIVPVCRFSGGELVGMDLTPVSLRHGERAYRRGRPRLAMGAEAEAIMSRFHRLSAALGTEVSQFPPLAQKVVAGAGGDP
ncbi:MAG: CapA family protein [Streptosporangiales bacterium]|nr:CapA family protein [Streptosporangiales bacterium]